MKKSVVFILLVLAIVASLIFVNKAQATDYLIFGKVYYTSNPSSETVAYGNITVYRLESGSYVFHGNAWTDRCGNYGYFPGESGAYKLVFSQNTRDVVDTSNNCNINLDNEPLTQAIVYPSTLTIFNPVAQANLVTLSQ